MPAAVCAASANYLQTERLDIFLSHAHLDHVAGLTYLINVVPADVVRNTTVHGEAAKLAAVREHLFAEPIFPVAPTFRFEPLGGICPLPGGGIALAFPLEAPRRLDRLSTRLARPFDGLRHRHDRRRECRLREQNSRRRLAGTRSLLSRTTPAISRRSPVTAACIAVAEVRLPRPMSADSSWFTLIRKVDADATFDLRDARRVFEKTEFGFDCTGIRVLSHRSELAGFRFRPQSRCRNVHESAPCQSRKSGFFCGLISACPNCRSPAVADSEM